MAKVRVGMPGGSPCREPGSRPSLAFPGEVVGRRRGKAHTRPPGGPSAPREQESGPAPSPALSPERSRGGRRQQRRAGSGTCWTRAPRVRGGTTRFRLQCPREADLPLLASPERAKSLPMLPRQRTASSSRCPSNGAHWCQ